MRLVGSLRGKITHIFEDYCLVDVLGVGYRVFASKDVLSHLSIEEKVFFFTHLSVREDALILYGFLEKKEYDLFQKLISISGIGPKVALGILSTLPVDDFCKAIHTKNFPLLQKIPGIGKKTAERIILELKDKLVFAAKDVTAESVANSNSSGDFKSEGIAALMALGYKESEILPIIKNIEETEDVEAFIKHALRELSKR